MQRTTQRALTCVNMGWMVRFACFFILRIYLSGLGPLEVAYPVLPSGLEKPFAEALKAIGVNPLPDPARDFLSNAYRCR
jgi:uncharacterized SAM-binding protein YcdF (DUF218 family)